MKPHSLWLLRFLLEQKLYSPTIALPPYAPIGLCMSTLRGLEKRGYAKERRSGIWEATESGQQFATTAPALRSIPIRNTGLYECEFVKEDLSNE